MNKRTGKNSRDMLRTNDGNTSGDEREMRQPDITHKRTKHLYFQEVFRKNPLQGDHDMEMQQIELRPDFWISLLTGPPDRSTAIRYHKKPALIDFGFILSGRLSHRLTDRGKDKRIEGNSGLSGIGFFPDSKGIVTISGNRPVRILHVHISPKRLYERVRDDLDVMPPMFRRVVNDDSGGGYLSKSAMTPAVWATALDIFNDEYKGLPKKLCLECKALELISLRLGSLMAEHAGCQAGKGLCPKERDRIRAAREWLVQDLSSPPSLRDLENRFCLSSNKLQAGFRALFDNSVFGHLREHKMQQAHILLAKADMNVCQVAWAVGYDNVSQFTKAYKKHFGMLPGQYRRSVLNR